MWFEDPKHPVCDYADLQQIAVAVANDGDIMVEVGCFVGESVAHLIDLIRDSRKRIEVYAVDLFDVEVMVMDGDHRKPGETSSMDDVICPTGMTARQWVDTLGTRAMLAEFYDNLRYFDRDKLLTGTLVGATAKMAERFKDGSIKFCLLDASHGYEGMKADLAAWWPKMRPDGIFAGHDWFSGPSVRRAVKEFADEHGLMVGLGQSTWTLVDVKRTLTLSQATPLT